MIHRQLTGSQIFIRKLLFIYFGHKAIQHFYFFCSSSSGASYDLLFK